MSRLSSRPLGLTGLEVCEVTVGGAPLGSMPDNFGYEVAERDAVELVRTVLTSELRSIDTANGYSNGRSELRIGRALAENGGLPDDFLLTTKVDAAGRDYSGDRIRASLRESRERLGVPLRVVHLHDPEFFDFSELTARDGAVAALVDARDRGEVGHIGLAGGDVHEMRRYLDLGVFEVLLVHNRWTLVDRSAGELIEAALERGIGVVNAAVLGGGILADPSGRSTRYGYRDAPEELLRAISGMRRVCELYGTDLATAAIRFSVRDPRLATTIVGISRPERIDATVTAATADLPDDLWAELEALLPDRTSWLDFRAA
ncbi:MAG TPA: aldo/keto reductase [Diaminobutyricibacter sp.]